MVKYIKYEIRGTYKYILGIFALVLIVSTILYAYSIGSDGMLALGGMFIGLLALIIFATALTTFLYIVGSFKKELYEDRGYLTFTLPLTGNQIVGSKLIVAFMWFAILGIAIAVYNIILIFTFIPVDINLSEIFDNISRFISIKAIVYMGLSFIFSIITNLVTIYFSMALSRVTLRNKKIGSTWFIIFLVLSTVLSYGQFQIGDIFPYHLDLNTFDIVTMNSLTRGFHTQLDNGFVMSMDGGMGMDTGMLATNIGAIVYNIVTTVLLFLGTGYLIEKKIDL